MDRLGWAAGLTFAAHGLRLGVRVNDATLLDEVRPLLPTGARERDNGVVDHLFSVYRGRDSIARGRRSFHLLYCNEGRLSRTLFFEELLANAALFMEEMVVVGAPYRMFVHAGVVGWRGRAIVLPGPSHSGKTTLVAALLRRGASYLSDEYAVIDPSGRVHPYPRAPRVRTGDDAVGTPTSVATFGASIRRRSMPVGLVLLTAYHPNRRWRVARVPRGEAALRLMRHIPAARLMATADLMTTLTALVEAAPVFVGVRGDAEAACSPLLELAQLGGK